MMTDATVLLWEKEIAAVTWDDKRELGIFQYDPEFVKSGIEVAPIMMPLEQGTFQFPALSSETFKRLPGLLADSLPDKFGNALIDAWLARQGRTPSSFNPVERLCYIGSRGMGGLEFKPRLSRFPSKSQKVAVGELVELANLVVNERASLATKLTETKLATDSPQVDVTDSETEAIQDILRVGTSAGGARAKAILAWNESTNEFRSGQLPAEDGFTQWILKFDGITNNKDKELNDPQGYGLIEYAYHLMALEAGIEMTQCRIHHEGGRSHFMTQRFDRTKDDKKLHMQSLCALNHLDFNLAGAHSYEQAIQTCGLLKLPMEDLEQQFRRAIFNVVARNQDDHVKNIAFLMNKSGHWRLSPAYDVAYSYNPNGAWTSQHQMTINAKRQHFDLDDLLALAATARIKTRKAKAIISEVESAVSRWQDFAEQAGVTETKAKQIANELRVGFIK